MKAVRVAVILSVGWAIACSAQVEPGDIAAEDAAAADVGLDGPKPEDGAAPSDTAADAQGIVDVQLDTHTGDMGETEAVGADAGAPDAGAPDAAEDVETCPDECAEQDPEVPMCHESVWDPEACLCNVEPLADGSGCDDGDTCTLGDACLSGVCEAGLGSPAPESCQTGIDSIAEMPNGATIMDFDTCGGCPCCGDGGAWPTPLGNACVTCSIEATLAQYGLTKQGASGSTMVGCITGNDDAPMKGQVLFVGGAFKPDPDTYGFELNLPEGVKSFGFSAVPSSSNSAPQVTLEGYDPNGVLVGQDSFDFTGFEGGGCPNTNPAVQFFGFRACCGTMTKVVAKFTNPNVTVDNVVIFPLVSPP